MKTIAVFTTTRAEFGILTPLIKSIQDQDDLKCLLFAGGSHLASEYGLTINEIKESGISITDQFDYLLNQDTAESLVRSSGIALLRLADLFLQYPFDFVCVVGDRFELLSIVHCAILFRKPIIHIHGGESSVGSIDEQIRHMITKAAHLHFTAAEEYAQNIRNMGEQPFRVFNTGALCVDGIVNRKKMEKERLFQSLALNVDEKTILITYHPVTLEAHLAAETQIDNLFLALKKYDFQAVVTAPNAEVDRGKINKLLLENVGRNNRYHYIHSLGINNYYNLVPHCEFVIGNSSSGIIEVPFFKIPTVNIGDRQKGRIRHESVIDADYSVESINGAIEKVLLPDFRRQIQMMPYKFGDGNAAVKMIEILKTIEIDQSFLCKTPDFSH
jgi:GDP/UDP-N,N'-diacetylbacillosamine 2-epimerase (hydrolysing)